MNTTSHANWFETFFEGITVELWGEFVKNVPSTAEVDYLERQLGKKPGASVLDVACGAGRHSLELARRGYEVVGVDISRESIEAARKAAAEANLSIDFRWGDMRSVSGCFDAAFCWGNSFGYLPHADTKQFLTALAKSLRPGSSFVLQTGMVAESLFPNFRREEWFEIGDIGFRIRNTYELESSALQTEYSFTRNGKTETRLGWQTVYTSGELCRLFAEAGLNVIHMHQNIEGQPYEFGAQMLLLTAQRPG